MKPIPNQDLWVPVVSFEGLYVVNAQGVIKTLHKRKAGNVMAQRIDRSGYLTVKLSKRDKDTTRTVHRILAEAFLPNPEGKPYANHINGNKLDNILSNLEWVTASENSKHAYNLGLIITPQPKVKPVLCRCSGQRFTSIREAADSINLPYATVKHYLSGKRNNPTCLSLEEKLAA